MTWTKFFCTKLSKKIWSNIVPGFNKFELPNQKIVTRGRQNLPPRALEAIKMLVLIEFKVNFELHDVIICLYWNLKTDCLISWEVKKTWWWDLGSWCEYYIRKIFILKTCKKKNQKLVPDHYLILANTRKITNVFEELIL